MARVLTAQLATPAATARLARRLRHERLDAAVLDGTAVSSRTPLGLAGETIEPVLHRSESIGVAPATLT